MARLFGRSYSRNELMRRTGNADQFGGVRLSRLEDGKAHDVLVADFRTGSGLSFTVAPGRGMDIVHSDYCGIPLCWRSSTGDVASEYAEPEEFGWLQGFFGGLVATCGLTYAGAPCVDEGKPLGLHGRVSNIPATNVLADTAWEGDELLMWCQGKVREASVFGPNIVLSRRVSAKLGEKRLFINDVVANEGHETQPHMLIYHINIGYPAVSEDSVFMAPSARQTPRDEPSVRALDRCFGFEAPEDGVPEQLFRHDMVAGPDGRVLTAIVNKTLNFGVYLRHRLDQLPVYSQWKMCASGHYVCGMEPANCEVTGRARARQEGKLQFLQPGEARSYDLELGVVSGADEVARIESEIRATKG